MKELISYELSPSVYLYLFQCIMSESAKVGVSVGVVNNIPIQIEKIFLLTLAVAVRTSHYMLCHMTCS